MRKISFVTILFVSSVVILACAITIMVIALTRNADVPYMSFIFASGSHWPTLISGTAGAVVAFYLVTHNERRKETQFERRVKNAIQYELKQYYEVLNDALRTGTPRTDRANTLAIDRNSEIANKHADLNKENPIYTQIGIDTKIKTLDSSMIIRLDKIYREVVQSNLHLYFQDTGVEVYFAVSTIEAEKLKQATKDAMQLLD